MLYDLQTAIAIVIGGIGLTVIGFILKWAWVSTHKKIDDSIAFSGKAIDELWNAMKSKADDSELLRARNKQDEITEQLRRHEGEDRTRHESIITAMGRLEGKMDALLIRRRDREP